MGTGAALDLLIRGEQRKEEVGALEDRAGETPLREAGDGGDAHPSRVFRRGGACGPGFFLQVIEMMVILLPHASMTKFQECRKFGCRSIIQVLNLPGREMVFAGSWRMRKIE